MRLLLILTFLLTSSLFSEELRIKANQFDGDEKAGISVFKGDVNIIKEKDEINASTITIYTDEDNEPTKFVAVGDVSFTIETDEGAVYSGVAGKVIYIPEDKEYHFFNSVHLKQINEKKEIIGEEVILKVTEGKAYAKGIKDEPVIMIFEISDKSKKEE